MTTATRRSSPTQWLNDRHLAAHGRQTQLVRELAEYQAGREVVGTTLLEAVLSGRQVHVWTLSDGEHLLMLTYRDRFLHWEASHDPLPVLRTRALDWLSEPEGHVSLD